MRESMRVSRIESRIEKFGVRDSMRVSMRDSLRESRIEKYVVRDSMRETRKPRLPMLRNTDLYVNHAVKDASCKRFLCLTCVRSMRDSLREKLSCTESRTERTMSVRCVNRAVKYFHARVSRTV